MLSGDPMPIISQFVNSGATCTMPDGRRLTLQELATEIGDKTPQEAFAQCGYDLNEVMRSIGS